MANAAQGASAEPVPVEMGSPTAAPHPEEMKGTVSLRLGNWLSLTVSGRATPAGLVCAALLAGAVTIPLARALRGRF